MSLLSHTAPLNAAAHTPEIPFSSQTTTPFSVVPIVPLDRREPDPFLRPRAGPRAGPRRNGDVHRGDPFLGVGQDPRHGPDEEAADFGGLFVRGAGVPVAERDLDGVVADRHAHRHIVLQFLWSVNLIKPREMDRVELFSYLVRILSACVLE